MSVVKFEKPTQSRMDDYADALFQCLPACSHKEIARRMSKELGRTFRPHQVPGVLLYVRRNQDRLGWNVPHGKRSSQSAAEKGEPKFFHVLVEKGRDPYFDPTHEIQLNKGAVSTISHTASSVEHESQALKLAAAYLKSPSAAKWTRSLARRLAQIGEDAKELLGMITENGA